LSALLLTSNSDAKSAANFSIEFQNVLQECRVQSASALKFWLVAFLASIPSLEPRTDYPQITDSYLQVSDDVIQFVTVVQKSSEKRLKSFTFSLVGNGETAKLAFRSDQHKNVLSQLRSRRNIQSSQTDIFFVELTLETSVKIHRYIVSTVTEPENSFQNSGKGSVLRRTFKFHKLVAELSADTQNLVPNTAVMTQMAVGTFENVFNVVKILPKFFLSNPSFVGTQILSDELVLRSLQALLSGHFKQSQKLIFATRLRLNESNSIDSFIVGTTLGQENAVAHQMPIVFRAAKTPLLTGSVTAKITEFTAKNFTLYELKCEGKMCMQRTSQLEVSFAPNSLQFNTYHQYAQYLKTRLDQQFDQHQGNLRAILTGILLGSNLFSKTLKLILTPSDTSPETDDFVTIGINFDDLFSLIINIAEKTSGKSGNNTVDPCLTLNFGEKGRMDDSTFVINIEQKDRRVFKQSTEHWQVLTNADTDKYTLSVTKGVLRNLTGSATDRTIQMIENQAFSISSLFMYAESHRDFKTMLLTALEESTRSLRVPGTETTLFLPEKQDAYFTVKLHEGNTDALGEIIEKSVDGIEKELISANIRSTVDIVLVSSCWSENGVENFTLCYTKENRTEMTQCDEFNVIWVEKADQYNNTSIDPTFDKLNEITYNVSLTLGQQTSKTSLSKVEKDTSLSKMQEHPISKVNRLLLYTQLGLNARFYALRKLENVGYRLQSLFSTFFDNGKTNTAQSYSTSNSIFLPRNLTMTHEISDNDNKFELSTTTTAFQTYNPIKPVFLETYKTYSQMNFLDNYQKVSKQAFTNTPELDDKEWIDKATAYEKDMVNDVYSRFFDLSSIEYVSMPGILVYLRNMVKEWRDTIKPKSTFKPIYHYNLASSKHNLIDLNTEFVCGTNDRAGLSNNMRLETVRCPGEFRMMDNKEQKTKSLRNLDMVTVSKKGGNRNTALVVTLDGLDVVRGHKTKPNIVMVGGGTKIVTAGKDSDLIILDSSSEYTDGYINAGVSADNSLVIKNYPTRQTSIQCSQNDGCYLAGVAQLTKLFLYNVQHIVGMADRSEKAELSCALKSIDLNGGAHDYWDEIIVPALSCKHSMKISLRSFTTLEQTSQGDSKMTFDVITGPVNINLAERDLQGETLINVHTSFVNLKVLEVKNDGETKTLSFFAPNLNNDIALLLVAKRVTDKTHFKFNDGFLMKFVDGKLVSVGHCSGQPETIKTFIQFNILNGLPDFVKRNDILVSLKCSRDDIYVLGDNSRMSQYFYGDDLGDILMTMNGFKQISGGDKMLPRTFKEVKVTRSSCLYYWSDNSENIVVNVVPNQNTVYSVKMVIQKTEKQIIFDLRDVTNDKTDLKISTNTLDDTEGLQFEVTSLASGLKIEGDILFAELIHKNVFFSTDQKIYQLNPDMTVSERYSKFDGRNFDNVDDLVQKHGVPKSYFSSYDLSNGNCRRGDHGNLLVTNFRKDSTGNCLATSAILWGYSSSEENKSYD